MGEQIEECVACFETTSATVALFTNINCFSFYFSKEI